MENTPQIWATQGLGEEAGAFMHQFLRTAGRGWDLTESQKALLRNRHYLCLGLGSQQGTHCICIQVLNKYISECVIPTPVGFSTTSHFRLPPVMKDWKCLPARANQNSWPSSIALFIHPHSCFSTDILFGDLRYVSQDSDSACQAEIRDINRLVHKPLSLLRNPQIGVKVYSTGVTSRMWGCASSQRMLGTPESSAAGSSLDGFFFPITSRQTVFLFTDAILSCSMEAVLRRQPNMCLCQSAS